MGPRGRSTGSCRASTPTGRRPSTRSRSCSARCCRCSATARDRVHGLLHAGLASSCSRAGLYRLGRAALHARWSASSPRALLCTRFDFPFLAARGYIDIPYLALVVWAAALELERPRRGALVFLLLAAAGAAAPGGVAAHRPLLPVDVAWPRTLAPARIRYAALTGDRPGHLGGDSTGRHRRPAVLAAPHERPGRGARAPRGPVARSPSATREFLVSLDKLPVVFGRHRRARCSRVVARAPARWSCRWRCRCRRRHVRARRPRRAVGHRPLPARAVADGHGLRGRRARRAGRCCAGRVAAEGWAAAAGARSSPTASSSRPRA